MSDYSVTSYNPNKVYDMPYAYPTFNAAAANPQPQAVKTNYATNVSLETPPDTFELSAESKIKTKSDKKGMSTSMKWLLGIGGTAAAIYGCVVGHRTMTKPTLEKVAQNFSEIFRRDISKEEAKKMADKYKNIFKEKGKDEFCKKLYEQIKKDYGYEKMNIPLVFENLGKAREDGGQVIAHWNQFIGNIAINTEVFNSMPSKLKLKDKETLMQAIMHEFHHTKQAEYAFRTDSVKYLDMISNDKSAPELLLYLFENNRKEMASCLIKNNKNITKNNVEVIIDKHIQKLKDGTYKSDNEVMETILDLIKTRRKPSVQIFGGFEKFRKDSENYKQGLKYLDAHKNYSNNNMEIYDNNLLEKEAFSAGDKSGIIADYLKSIWRVF